MLPGRQVLRQRWSDLVFVHWRVDPGEVAPLLPRGIVPDVFDSSSWVGLIPFRMERTSLLGTPPVPYFGSFTEVNVRLYGVDERGRRGVVFASLEASRLLSVVTARVAFGLPYQWASATATRDGSTIRYTSRRLYGARPRTAITAVIGDEVTDDPLADFLTARWLLFETRAGRTITMSNEHEEWPLFAAEVVELRDELVAAAGFGSVASRAPDSVLYSPGVTTSFALPERRASGR